MKKTLYIFILLLLSTMAVQAQQVSYQWSTGETTANISPTPLVTTTYYVTVTQYGVAYFDSVTVVVNNPDVLTDNQVACDSFYWAPSDTTFYSSLVFIDTLTNSASCDSVVTLNLTISYTQIINDSIVYCPGGSQLTSGGTQILGLGLYQDTLLASSGCDSIILTHVSADTIAPVVITQNITAYLDASGFVSIVPADVDYGSFDNCTIDTMYLSETSFDCSQLGQNIVTLSAVDINGNMTSAIAFVDVLDTVSPIILMQSDTIYINQNGSANITLADIDAGSFDNCSIANSMIFPNSFSCAHANTQQTIYCSVTDGAGNNAATSVQVFIADTLAPVFLTDSLVAYLDQSGNASISTSDLISNISDNCGVDSVWLDTNAFDCIAANTYQTVFAFAIDGSNNVSSMMTQVLVLDTITPIVNAVSNITVYLDANGNASLTPADVENGSTDNCGITNQQLSQASFDCADQGMNEVTYTVADLSGNSSSALVIVNVIDNINSITGFTSANSAPTNSMRTYSVDSIADATYFWSVTNGVINAQSGASANVTWYNYSNGTIQVIQTTSNGCSDTLIQDIVLWPLGMPTMAAQPFEVSLYPNPARESINLELTRFEKASTLNNIKIFDIAGNILLSQEKVLMQLGEAHQIETRSFAKGVYFLTLENEVGIKTLRFVLQ